MDRLAGKGHPIDPFMGASDVALPGFSDSLSALSTQCQLAYSSDRFFGISVFGYKCSDCINPQIEKILPFLGRFVLIRQVIGPFLLSDRE